MDGTDTFAPLAPATEAENTPAATAVAKVWQPILPAPLPLPETLHHRRLGEPSRLWRYLDASGQLLFAVARFDGPDGTKEVLPYCCGQDRWVWKAPPAPRPLYGLDCLAARPHAPVLLVEGEKAADAGAALFPEHAVISWPGGSNAVGKADWQPLAGRHVAIWPDNDGPGVKAAKALVGALRAVGAEAIRTVQVPEEWPAGWDLADQSPEGVTPETLAEMLAAATFDEAVPTQSEREAEIARLAELDDVALSLERRDAARRLGISVADIMAAVKATRRNTWRAEREAIRAEREASAPPSANYTFCPLEPDDRGRVDLFVSSSDLPDTATDLTHLLSEIPHLFDRGGPCRLVFDMQRNGLVAEMLALNAIINETHRIARPWRFVKDRDGNLEAQAVTLPDRAAHLYLARRGEWNLRPLDGIAAAPLLADDGSLRIVDGYDPGTRMWCERMPAVEVPDAPTRDQAAAALRRLRHFLRTFPFADAKRVTLPGETVPVVDIDQPPGADESATLVALLTAICRPSLRLAPALLARAPAFSGAGTGKGLLIRVICAIAYGLHPRAMTAGGTAEELDKRIVAALIGAESVVFLDNVNGMALRSDALASAITERPAYVRILGQSVTVALNATAFICVTGNGIVLSEDLARRFLTVELDAGIEDPEARDFKGDVLSEAMQYRGLLLREALTIWRWGRLEGASLPAGRPLGSFQDWARWCRDPLLALGCADPALRVADAKANDPRCQQITEIFAAWWERHHDLPIRIADLHEDVRLVADPAGRGRQHLAAMIAKLEGTRAAGFVLSRHRSVGKWSPDLYALKRPAPEMLPPAGQTPMPPMVPMPTGHDPLRDGLLESARRHLSPLPSAVRGQGCPSTDGE